jgi:hypothetical protein
MMIIIIMSMGRYCVSELRTKTGPFFILQVIYEHGELWLSDIDRGKHMIRPPELCGNLTIVI